MRHDETNAATEKLDQTFVRYRSDMLGLAREQGRISDSTTTMAKRQETLAEAQEQITHDLTDLDSRFATQEKTAHDHFELSIRQGDSVQEGIANANRNAARLHDETEKRLGEGHSKISNQITELDHNVAIHHDETEKKLSDEHKNIIMQIADFSLDAETMHENTKKHLSAEHRDITRQITDLRQETKRRLLALDSIEASLEVLMIRTEPPIKRPFIAIRLFRRIRAFFHIKLPELIKRMRK